MLPHQGSVSTCFRLGEGLLQRIDDIVVEVTREFDQFLKGEGLRVAFARLRETDFHPARPFFRHPDRRPRDMRFDCRPVVESEFPRRHAVRRVHADASGLDGRVVSCDPFARGRVSAPCAFEKLLRMSVQMFESSVARQGKDWHVGVRRVVADRQLGGCPVLGIEIGDVEHPVPVSNSPDRSRADVRGDRQCLANLGVHPRPMASFLASREEEHHGVGARVLKGRGKHGRTIETEVEHPPIRALVVRDPFEVEPHRAGRMDLPLHNERLEIDHGGSGKRQRHASHEIAILHRPLAGVGADTRVHEVGMAHDHGTLVVMLRRRDVVHAWPELVDVGRAPVDERRLWGPVLRSFLRLRKRLDRYLRRPFTQEVAIDDNHRQVLTHHPAMDLQVIKLPTQPVDPRCHRNDPPLPEQSNLFRAEFLVVATP